MYGQATSKLWRVLKACKPDCNALLGVSKYVIKATMKRMKSFLEVIEHHAICRIVSEVNGGTGRFYKASVIKSKISALTAIFIPCLLQFQLLGFGQNWPDSVNGTFMFIKVAREGIQVKSVVGDCRNTVGEGGLEVVNGISQFLPFVLPVVDFHRDPSHQESTGRTKKVCIRLFENEAKYFHV